MTRLSPNVLSFEKEKLTPAGSKAFWPASTLLCSSSCTQVSALKVSASSSPFVKEFLGRVLSQVSCFFSKADVPGREQELDDGAAGLCTEQILLARRLLYPQRLPQACQQNETYWLVGEELASSCLRSPVWPEINIPVCSKLRVTTGFCALGSRSGSREEDG